MVWLRAQHKCLLRKVLVVSLMVGALSLTAVVAVFVLTGREVRWNKVGAADGRSFSVRIVKDGCLEASVIVYPENHAAWVRHGTYQRKLGL